MFNTLKNWLGKKLEVLPENQGSISSVSAPGEDLKNTLNKFISVRIPINEIAEEEHFYRITAKGMNNNQKCGFNLLIKKTFNPIFLIENGEFRQVHDALTEEVEGGIILYDDREGALKNFINELCDIVGLKSCSLVCDMLCNAQLLFGDIKKISPYKTDKVSAIMTQAPELLDMEALEENQPNFLRFKARSFYLTGVPEGAPSEDKVESIPFFIDVDLVNKMVIFEEKDLDVREHFIDLFRLDQTYAEARANTPILLVTKKYTEQITPLKQRLRKKSAVA